MTIYLYKGIKLIPMYFGSDFFNYFKRYTSGTRFSKVSRQQHAQICELTNVEIMNELMLGKQDVVLPFSIGRLGLRKVQFDFENKNLLKYFVDNKKTREFNKTRVFQKKIYNLHDTTNGYIPFIRYIKPQGYKMGCNASVYSLRFMNEWYDQLKTNFFSRKLDLNIMKLNSGKDGKSS